MINSRIFARQINTLDRFFDVFPVIIFLLKDFYLNAITHYAQRESFIHKLTEAEYSLKLLNLYLV